MAARGGCVAKLLGVLFMVLAAISKLASFHCCNVGPKSFAAAAALLLLLSIAVNSCPYCGGACKEGECGHDHEHGPGEGKK
jgi:hypothetical protein